MPFEAVYCLTEIVPGTPLLRVSGDVDACAISDFRDAVAAAETRTTCGLVVALDDARLWCAAPYSVLLAAAARLDVMGRGPLLVVCANDRLESRVLKTLHFEGGRVETIVAAMATLRTDDSSIGAVYAEGLLRAAVS